MKKLTITNINRYMYFLKDNEEKEYIFTFEFHNLEKEPAIGNNIYIADELLNDNYRGYSDFYAFGPLNSQYGRVITNENDPDIIVLDMDNKQIYLKRLYG